MVLKKKSSALFILAIFGFSMVANINLVSGADYSLTLWAIDIYAHDDHDWGTGEGEFFIEVRICRGGSCDGWITSKEHPLEAGEEWVWPDENLISENINSGDEFEFRLIEKDGTLYNTLFHWENIVITSIGNTVYTGSEGTNKCTASVYSVVTNL